MIRGKVGRLLLILTSAAVMLSGCSSAVKPNSEQSTKEMSNLKLDSSIKYQEIEGFGASGAWWSQDIGGWPDEKRSKILDLLFDKEKGIGLNIYRYNVGAGEGHSIQDAWRKSESFEVSKGKYDWSKDANAVKVMKEAVNRGVNNIVFFANSPTARMTVSGRVTGENTGQSNLKKDMYADFSDYLIDVSKHFIEEEKLPVKWISPINEPEWDWQESKGQEGCHYTPEECREFLKVFVGKLKESGINAKTSAGELGQWSDVTSYMKTILEDEGLRKELSPFAIHSYWSDRTSKVIANQFLKTTFSDTKLWMSEWTEMQGGRDTGMDSALTMAEVINDDLTIGSVTSWQYWIAVSKYDYRDGLIYTDEGKQNVIETKRLWVLGNYSKFIDPGFTRINVESENEDLKVSAFTDGNKKTVIVAVNNSKETVQTKLNTTNTFNSSKIYETSDKKNLEEVYSGKAKDTYEFTPKSVTTIVLE